ncbi:MAG: preprotein translocase subunit SecE [Gammaproteobacteria bacterium]|nr:preprotein translocase subunit SecE [Gammaproteobacteria bacterium]NNF62509.1 preprotein translocase subunit SecE [Gammaproteobacteria bacterium]
MSTKTEQSVGPVDTVKLVLAAALLIGGLVGYYYFAGQYSQLYRAVGVILAVVFALLVGMWSDPGQRLWRFAQGSRIELRKVFWPTRNEALQTTIAVIIFVIIMGVFFWALDMLLLWATQALTGRGA